MRSQRLVLAGFALVVAFAVWRATIGADFGDGTHVVALAMRMAQGDVPLADELNLQALGSVAAVPFTWVWLNVVGVDGIVLAARLFYVAVAALAGVLAYRALRTGFAPLPCFVAVTVMVLPTPYSLMVVSYNTMPVLGLAVATCGAFAALRTGSGRWAVLTGLALAWTVLSHPAALPPAATVAVVVLALAPAGPVRRGVLAGGLGASALLVAWVLVGPGVGALVETLRYTGEYQAERPGPGTRLAVSLRMHAEGLLAWRNLPALLLAALAALPRIPRRGRTLLAAAAVVALAGAVVVGAVREAPDELLLGPVASAFIVLVAVLLLPFLLSLGRPRDDRFAQLLLLTAPSAVIGFVSLSLTSSASAKWGVAAAPVQPFVGVVALLLLVVLARHRTQSLAVLTSGALVVSLLAVHHLRTYRNGPPWRLADRVAAGPLMGLLTSEDYLRDDCDLRRTVRDWVDEDDSVFFWGRASGYAYSTARMDTHNVWLPPFGPAHAHGARWMTEHDRWPDVVVIHRGSFRAAGGWDAQLGQDPVLTRVHRDYGEPTETGGYLVLRRDGEVRQQGPPPEGCATD